MAEARQPELFPEGDAEALVEELRRLLLANGWLTRQKLTKLTGWKERTLRKVAELAGADIVRGPRGFNLEPQCSIDELKHCAEIQISQGKKMNALGLAWLKRAHRRVAA